MTSKPPFGGEVVRLGELIRPSSVERCGDRSFPILSITKQDGITFQADKFKKRIASANTNTYKVIPRGKLVQGIHIDEANFGIQDNIDYGVVSPAYKVWDVNSDRVVPEYLAQALRSDYCIDYYRKNLSGTVNRRGRMSNEVFYQLALFLPSLAEQKRRLDVLQHVSALVQCQTRAVEAFDSLVKSRVSGAEASLLPNLFSHACSNSMYTAGSAEPLPFQMNGLASEVKARSLSDEVCSSNAASSA